MKQFKFYALVLLGIMLSINQVWGASPLTLTMNKAAIGNVTSLTNQSKTISGYELYFTSVTSAGNDFVQLAKSSSLYNNTAIPGAISSVKLTNCATTSAKTDGGYTVYGSTNGSSWTEIGSVTGLSSTTADKTTDFTGSYSYFKITVNSARVLKISSIVISYSTGSTYTVNYAGLEGATCATKPTSGTTDAAFAVSAPTKSGSVFTGWTVTYGLVSSTAKWGTTSTPATAIANASTRCYNSSSDVYFKNLCAAGGTVTLTANWAPEGSDVYNGYAIIYNLTGVTKTGGPTYSNPNLKLNFQANGGYTMPGSITVKIGNTTLAVGSGRYTWNTDGLGTTYYLNITESQITNDVTITITATGGTPYKVTFSEGTGNTLNCGSCTDKAITGANITLPTATPCSKAAGEGWQFDGWSETRVASASASYTKVANPYQPTQARTLYAVYQKPGTTITSTTFVRQGSTMPTTGKRVVLAQTNAASSVISNTTSGKRIVATSATISSDNLTTTDANVVWEVAQDGGYYTFRNVVSGKYLGSTGSDNASLLSSVTDYAKWAATATTSGFKLKNKSTNEYLTYSSQGGGWSTDSRDNGTTNNVYVYQKDASSVTINSIYQYDISSICSASYSVTYQGNGNTSGSVPVDVNSPYADGTLVTVLGNTGNLAKTGYSFNGWKDDNEAEAFAAGDKFSIDRDYVMKAQWQAITYSVRYNKNNGDATGSMSNSSHTYGTAKNLTNNEFSLAGHTFAGWATSADGDVVYTNGKSVTNLASTQGAVVDLYAKWTPTKYTLTYANGGGSGTAPAAVDNLTMGQEVTLATNTFTAPAGKKFNGWNDGTNTYAAGASYTMPAKNVTMTAQWSDVTYTDYITECTPQTCEYNINYQGGGYGSEWVENVCFSRVGETSEWRKTNFVMPALRGNFWVGNGAWADGHSSNLELTNIKIGLQDGTFNTWSPMEGAVGTLRIYSDAPEANYKVAFLPTYQITFGGVGVWDNIQFAYVSGTMYETEEITTPLDLTGINYYVGVRNSDGNTNFVKWSDADNDKKSLTLALSGMGGMAAGIKGKYRIWEDSGEKNWYCTFIPTPIDHYYVNGTDTYQEYPVDGHVTLPSATPESCDPDEYPYFVGWSATNFNSTTTEPELITAETASAGGNNYYAVFAKGTAGTAIFTETFDTNEGTGGNDSKWDGSIANASIASDNDDWIFVKGNGANACAKFGTGSVLGSAQTPAITMTSGTLTFKAAAWNGGSESTTLKLSLTSGTLKDGEDNVVSSVTLTKGAWTDYTLYISGVTTSTKIKFEGNAASNSRFFLDEVVVSGETNFTEWVTTCAAFNKYDVTLAVTGDNGSADINSTTVTAGNSASVQVRETTGTATISNIQITNPAYELASVSITSGAGHGDLTDNGDGTYTVSNVSGALTVTVAVAAKTTYPISFSAGTAGTLAGGVVDLNTYNGGTVTIPAGYTASSTCGTFVGWAEAKADGDKPATIYKAGENYTLTLAEAKTLYAVYSVGAGCTQEFALGVSGEYLMYGYFSSNKYYATAKNSSAALYANTETDIATNSRIKSVLTLTYDAVQTAAWNETGVYAYTIRVSNGGTDYGYWTNNSSTNLSFSPTTPYYWKVSARQDATNGDGFAVVGVGPINCDGGSNFNRRASAWTLYFEPAEGLSYYTDYSCSASNVDVTFNYAGTINWPDDKTAEDYRNLARCAEITEFPEAEYTGWTFLGWSRSNYNDGKELNDENGSTELPDGSTIYKTGGNTLQLSGSSVTLYPIFTKFANNEPMDLVNGGDYYLYVLKGENDAYGAPVRYYSKGSLSSGKFSATTNCSEAQAFHFEKEAEGWVISFGTNYLGANEASLTSSRSTKSYWVISNDGGTNPAGAYRMRLTTDAADGVGARALLAQTNGASVNFQHYALENLTNSPTMYKDIYLGTCTERYFSSAPGDLRVTYHHGDGTTETEDVEYGAYPDGVEAMVCSADRVFVGWSETPIAEAVQDEPATVDPTTVAITSAKHFYAVYASKNGAEGEDLMHTETFAGIDATSSYANGSWTSSNGVQWNYTNMRVNNPAAIGSNGIVYYYGSERINATITTAMPIANLSKIALKARRANAVSIAVSYSENGTSWTKVGDNLTINTTAMLENVRVLPTVGDYYLKIDISNTESGTYAYIDDIKLYSSHTDVLTDYSTSCDKTSANITWNDADGVLADGQTKPVGSLGSVITLPLMEKGCSLFKGWQASVDGVDKEVFMAGERYLINHDVTFTALWEVNLSAPVTVTYHTGLEGATTQTVSGVHCGDILTDVQVPTPAACGQNEFAGWAIGEFANCGTTDALPKYVVGTDVVMGNMELHAIWKQGKSVFTKYTDDPADFSGTYIIVDPTTSKALSASLAPTPVEIVADKITTDEGYIQWKVAKTANGYSIRSINGYLNITADKTQAMGLSNTLVDNWNMKESSTNGIYNIGKTFGGSDRRVCFNATKSKWVSYKNRTSGNLYKLTGDGPSVYTMDGFCPHIYHATGVDEMTSGKAVSVMSATTGTVIVENTSVVPVAQKVSGDDVFVVTVNPESTGTNGDGSLNYAYSVKFTPTAGNQTYTATYKFIGTDETEDAKHIASEMITFTGYSLPDEFAIAVLKDGQYYALPGNVASASTPDSILLDVEKIDGVNVAMNMDEAHKYSVYTGTVVAEERSTVRLKSTTGALWATAAANANVDIFTNALTAANESSANGGAKVNTQWTLERVYRESDDAFLGYHLISDANTDKGLFYKNADSHWGYYDQNYYGGKGYSGEILFLPLAKELGIELDIVDWGESTVTLNMNGYSSEHGEWAVETNGSKKAKGDRAGDRTLEMPLGSAVADKYVRIKTYESVTLNAQNKYESGGTPDGDRYYKVPHIFTTDTTISSSSAYNANSILYVKSGKLTINTNLTISKVIVNEEAELEIKSGAELTIKDKLVLRTEPWHAAILTNHGKLTRTNVFYTRRHQKGGKFQQFSLPYASSTTGVKLSNGVTPTYGSTYTIRTYNCATRATNGADGSAWETLPAGTIAAHTGYTFLVSNNYYREFYFPVAIDPRSTSVAVSAHASENPADANWNFISSPLSTYAKLVQPALPSEQMKICEMVDDNEIYWQHVPTVINPVVPFYYQAPENKTLSFSATPVAAVAARVAADEVQEQWLQLIYENEAGVMDETNLYVHPTKFSPEYELGYDEAKMKSTATHPQIYTQLACGDLAFAAIPDSMLLTPIPVAVYSPATGEYTFSLTENDYLSRMDGVTLTDTQTGAVTNLLLSTYTVALPQGTTTGRFFLSGTFKTPGIATDIDPWIPIGGWTDGKAEKFLWHEHIYIRKGEHVYDVNGNEVKLFNE